MYIRKTVSEFLRKRKICRIVKNYSKNECTEGLIVSKDLMDFYFLNPNKILKIVLYISQKVNVKV